MEWGAGDRDVINTIAANVLHEKWRKNHPYLDAHPELRPAYVREQAAQRGEYLPVRRDPADWADRSDRR